MPSQTTNGLASWVSRYWEMSDEWQSLAGTTGSVDEWERRLARMGAEVADLRAVDRWHSGGRTLLHALGVHRSELHLCRGLAWLLDPDGWHGLGTSVLEALLSHLSLPLDGAERATVAVEETCKDTRADIVVRTPGTTLILEAKVFAREQPAQCDRLAREWANESPTLVYLTRSGRPPTTAFDTEADWQTMTWRTIASLASSAARRCGGATHGVWEFIETLERDGGPVT